MWFDSASPLRSGWAWGQNYLEGGTTAFEATFVDSTGAFEKMIGRNVLSLAALQLGGNGIPSTADFLRKLMGG